MPPKNEQSEHYVMIAKLVKLCENTIVWNVTPMYLSILLLNVLTSFVKCFCRLTNVQTF